jgi:hypothetical protein
MNDLERTAELFRRDRRFRLIVDSIVARTMQEHGPVEPEKATAEAHDIAQKVAALLLQQIYDGDAEMVALRAERDHWKERALSFANLAAPPAIVVPLKTKEGKE